jgi:hypothetical protein
VIWVLLGLSIVIFWIALEVYWQAQRADSRHRATKAGLRRLGEWVQSQLPKGINTQKTVAVDYKAGFSLPDSWDSEDFERTQHVADRDSGFRFKA